MSTDNSKITLKLFTVFSFVLMIVVNALANIIPINGVTTGEVSNAYPNFFAPAAYTFSIWGLIYILLFLHTLYQIGFFREENCSSVKRDLLNYVGFYFSISSIANAAWIIAWHYHMITLSMVLMIVILISLIIIYEYIKKEKLNKKDEIFINLPFSIYFGWITVATIANATTLLVSWGWNGFGLSDVLWTSIILVAGVIIGIATIIKNCDLAYGLVFIWAYNGILVKHISPTGFGGQYHTIIYTLIFTITLLILSEFYVLYKRGR